MRLNFRYFRRSHGAHERVQCYVYADLSRRDWNTIEQRGELLWVNGKRAR